MKTVDQANQVLTFVLELAVYVGVVVWAFSTSVPTAVRAVLAAAAVAVMATSWGLLAAPKATYPIHGAALVAFEIAWFGLGAVALYAGGLRQWGVALVVVVVLNGALRAALV